MARFSLIKGENNITEINENIALKESISPSSRRIIVRLFSKRSLITSKCGKNEKRANEVQPSVSLMFTFFIFLETCFRHCSLKFYILFYQSIRSRKALVGH